MNRTRNFMLGAIGAVALLVAAACSGGSSSTPNVPYPVASGLGSLALPSGSNGTVLLAPVSGFGTGSVTLSGSGTVNVTQSATNPTGLQPLNKKSLKGAAPVPQGTTDPNTGIAYITINAGTAVTIKSIVGVTVTPTGTVPPGPYYEAFWNGTQWVTIGSACTLASGTIGCGTVQLATPVSIPSGGNYYVAIYAGIILTTPTPPPPAPVASPSSITISLQTTGTVTIATNPNSAVTAQSSDNNIVTVTPSVTSDSKGNAVFTLTASSTNVGTANVTFTDAVGQTTKVAVTTTNTYAPPNPSQNNIVFSLGSQTTLTVTTKPNTQVTAVSSNTSVLTVNSPVTADNTGTATFTIVAAGPGTATVTFTDTFSQTGTFSGTVSNVKNGAFTVNGVASLANWTPCSYAHSAVAGPINESTPMPVASPVATQSPGAATTPIPSANLTTLVNLATPPPNDNPSPPAGVGATAPPVLGSNVALVGTLNAATTNSPKGEFGMCQTVTVSSNTPYLTFWIWEGGSNYNFKSTDQNVEILDSTGTTILQTLFAEAHCYIHPPSLGSPGAATTSGCWPSAYGGDTGNGGLGYKDWIGGGFWSSRGPYDLSSYHGQTITLYFGQYSYYANTTNPYSNFIYVGNVQMLPTNTFPTSTPLAKRTMTLQLHPR